MRYENCTVEFDEHRWYVVVKVRDSDGEPIKEWLYGVNGDGIATYDDYADYEDRAY